MFQLLEVTYPIDSVQPVLKWVTIGLVVIALVAGIVCYFAKRELFPRYCKYGLIALSIYAVLACITLLGLDIQKHYSESYAEENWLELQAIQTRLLLPLGILIALLLVSGLALLLVFRCTPRLKKPVLVVCGVLCGLALIAAIALMLSYYLEYIQDGGYYDSEEAKVYDIPLYVSAVVLILLALAFAFGFGRKEKNDFSSKSISYAAICIAMSFVLSYAKLWEMPQGGSVTFASLLPLMLYSYIFGVKKGIFAGFIYGILQAVQDPWLIHPAQFLLDYPIAFSFIGLAGMFRNLPFAERMPQLSFTLGAIVAVCFRFLSHLLSGVFAFEIYAIEEGQNAWIYSLAYNSFTFVDLLIVLVAGVLVLSSKSLVRQMTRIGQAG